jgi:hypothetical protein
MMVSQSTGDRYCNDNDDYGAAEHHDYNSNEDMLVILAMRTKMMIYVNILMMMTRDHCMLYPLWGWYDGDGDDDDDDDD